MRLNKTDLWAIRDALYLTTLNVSTPKMDDPSRVKELHQAKVDLLALFEEEIENSSSDDTWTFEQN